LIAKIRKQFSSQDNLDAKEKPENENFTTKKRNGWYRALTLGARG